MRAGWTLTKLCLSEALSRGEASRVPEPAMVMEALEQVADYAAAGMDTGAMTPTHLLHTAQAAALIGEGDRVLDLGCGPGTQTLQLAELHPEARFTGVDLSAGMLEVARQRTALAGLTNTNWQEGDITSLSGLADGSFDVVICCMTLHHLPTTRDLRRCFIQIRRVLRRGGRIYLADFARLRSAWSMQALSHMRADQQPAHFTRDYHNSLRAAFSARQWVEAAEATDLARTAGARHHQTWPIGLMQMLSSAARGPMSEAARAKLTGWRDGLSAAGQSDLTALAGLFRRGGMDVAMEGV